MWSAAIPSPLWQLTERATGRERPDDRTRCPVGDTLPRSAWAACGSRGAGAALESRDLWRIMGPWRGDARGHAREGATPWPGRAGCWRPPCWVARLPRRPPTTTATSTSTTTATRGPKPWLRRACAHPTIGEYGRFPVALRGAGRYKWQLEEAELMPPAAEQPLGGCSTPGRGTEAHRAGPAPDAAPGEPKPSRRLSPLPEPDGAVGPYECAPMGHPPIGAGKEGLS